MHKNECAAKRDAHAAKNTKRNRQLHDPVRTIGRHPLKRLALSIPLPRAGPLFFKASWLVIIRTRTNEKKNKVTENVPSCDVVPVVGLLWFFLKMRVLYKTKIRNCNKHAQLIRHEYPTWKSCTVFSDRVRCFRCRVVPMMFVYLICNDVEHPFHTKHITCATLLITKQNYKHHSLITNRFGVQGDVHVNKNSSSF